MGRIYLKKENATHGLRYLHAKINMSIEQKKLCNFRQRILIYNGNIAEALAIAAEIKSYDIVKTYGGQINLETQEGTFTEFSIQIPIK